MTNKTKTILLALLLSASTGIAMADDTMSTVSADNTALNKRDQNADTLTPVDQASGSKRDVELTRRIRKMVVKDKTLSSDAHNIKIVTLNGVTTLRGPVDSKREMKRIKKIAYRVVGSGNLHNKLEVKKQ